MDTSATDAHTLASFQEGFRYRFSNADTLREALTHPSYVNEGGAGPSNQRLEFLGDAVLGLITAHTLYRHDGSDEGGMSKLRSRVVRTDALASLARELGLFESMLLGRGQRKEGPSAKLMADVFEALVGAVFVDGGFQAAEATFAGLINRQLEALELDDYKTRLQEYAQREKLAAPRYQSVQDGRTFSARVAVAGHTGEGQGSSKKAAEQAAAASVLTSLGLLAQSEG